MRKTDKLILTFFLLILYSCNLNVVEKQYPDYDSAVAENFHQRGWIPEEFFQKSIKNIKQKADLDTNNYYAMLQITDKADWSLILNLLTTCDLDIIIPKWIDEPKWWTKELQTLEKYCFIDKYQRSYQLALDDITNTIYFWR